MKEMIPHSIKPIIRWFYYKNERKKVLREIEIRRKQDDYFSTKRPEEIKKLIIFLVEGADWFTGIDNISGGILSIASIYEETIKLKDIHDSDVIMATLPDSHLLFKHTQFPNTIPVFRYKQLLKFTNLESLIVHIPEYRFSEKLVDQIRKTFLYLERSKVHLNILNQNIDLMPVPEVIEIAKKEGYFVTQTTAHEQYSTEKIRNKYGIPLHKFSVYATPEKYSFTHFSQKENLILISPDEGSFKDSILAKLEYRLPDYKIKIIKNISYSNYLLLVQKAKFTITFGEGLDFYFIETVFSGGIAFAEFNTNFFTSDFHNMEGIFNSYEEMEKLIVEKIKLFDSSLKFKEVNDAQFRACHKIYNRTSYVENLKNFYKKNYLLS